MRRFINLVESLTVTEAPVADMGFSGDLNNPGSYREDDLKKIRSPEWRARVVKILEKAPVDIGLYFVNGPAEKRLDFSTPTYKLDIDLSTASTYVGIQSKDWARRVMGGKLPTGYETRVNVILAQNEGTDRVGLTPWLVAHRIGHCFFENNNRPENRELRSTTTYLMTSLISFCHRLEVLFSAKGLVSEKENDSDQRIRNVIKLISPFRSARAGTLRDNGEYLVELFAQFLTSGRVTFNRFIIDGKPRTVRREMAPDEAELFLALKAKLTGYSQQHPIKLGWWDHEMEWIWSELRYLQARPRTRDGLRKLYEKWVEEGFFTNPSTGTDKMHLWMDEMEDTLNNLFTGLLEETTGKFVVL
jgi:hypothetical protein